MNDSLIQYNKLIEKRETATKKYGRLCFEQRCTPSDGLKQRIYNLNSKIFVLGEEIESLIRIYPELGV